MPPPTNTSGAAAIELGPLPNTLTQDVNDAGTTYTVWYKYTAQTGDNVIGVFAHSDDLALYKPVLELFTPDAVTAFPMMGSYNVPAQFPVTAGHVYYLRITSYTGNVATAHLTIEGYRQTPIAMAGSAILIPDDVPGYPMAIIDTSTGAVSRFVQGIPAGETAAQWTTGEFALEAWTIFPSQTTSRLRAYSSSLTQLFETVLDPVRFQRCHLSSNRHDNWYVLLGNVVAGTAPTIQRLNGAGAVTATWSLTPFSSMSGTYYRPRSLATSRTDTIAYIGETGDRNVKRWDLVANVALSDLVANLPGYYPLELLVLADESVVVCWWTQLDNGHHGDVILRRYSSSGTLLTDYGSFGDCQDPRIASAAADPASFWLDQKPYPMTAEATITVKEIRASDGAVLTSVSTVGFEQGKYAGTATLTPPALFGRSESCPIVIMPPGMLPPDGGNGGNGGNGGGGGGGGGTEPPYVAPSYHLDARYIRRLRRAPHLAQENVRLFYRKFELDLERGVGLATGQGVEPLVMLRLSRDGGHTWGEPLTMSAGALGAYTQRVIARRLGQARDTVFEVTVSDPVAWSLVNAWLDLEPGTS
jgi:hypothetical protein